MIRFVTEHTEIVCNPAYADWQCALSVGSTSALDIAIRMFCERGDFILSEDYAFASAVETAAALGVGFIGVAELFSTAQSIGQRDFKILEMLLLAGAVYWIITIVLSSIQMRLEQRMETAYSRET